MRGRIRKIGHYAGGSDLEENWRSAGLKLCKTVNRAQAVEKQQRRLYTDRDRRCVESSRGDRAGRRAQCAKALPVVAPSMRRMATASVQAIGLSSDRIIGQPYREISSAS